MKLIKNTKIVTLFTGIELKNAILIASYNPAKIIGLQNRKGSIEIGKDADIIAIDENINVYTTMVEGSVVYDNL